MNADGEEEEAEGELEEASSTGAAGAGADPFGFGGLGGMGGMGMPGLGGMMPPGVSPEQYRTMMKVMSARPRALRNGCRASRVGKGRGRSELSVVSLFLTTTHLIVHAIPGVNLGHVLNHTESGFLRKQSRPEE